MMKIYQDQEPTTILISPVLSFIKFLKNYNSSARLSKDSLSNSQKPQHQLEMKEEILGLDHMKLIRRRCKDIISTHKSFKDSNRSKRDLLRLEKKTQHLVLVSTN
jgi:hypothetical protein